MLLILISWIYIFAITSIIGIGVNKLLSLNIKEPVFNLFIGFFYITLFTGFWAIFYRVNWEYHVVLITISTLLVLISKSDIKFFLLRIRTDFQELSQPLKWLLIIISILALAKSATSPYLIDNESYYIQTIKWINEYGFVKGLVNLHPFLGQTSGWHILQAAFNFSFIYDKFNDLNGIALIFANFFSLVKLNKYYNSSNKTEDLIIGLFPLSNLFFFQFISAPSPDIPVYIISFFIFYLFLKNYSIPNKSQFNCIALLSIFIVLIKVTSVSILLLPLILLIKHSSKTKLWLKISIPLGLLTLTLFLIKNFIITGNSFYPIGGINTLQANWKLTQDLETFFYEQTKYFGYFVNYKEYHENNFIQLFLNWLMQPKLHGIFNKAIIILLIVFPFFIKKSKLKKESFIILIVSVLNMILLFMTSPQYRFFYQFILVLSLIILITITQNRKIILSLLTLSTLATIIPILFLSNISALTKNNFHLSNPTFSYNEIITPYENSRYGTKYESIKLDYFEFNSPTEIDFFWGTGDIPLPALNKKQYEWFKKYYHVVPCMRTDDLKDGFYSKIITQEPSHP